MDEALAELVLANLGRYASDATMIIAAHHPREIALTSRTVSLGSAEALDGKED
jgi:hypothetical protein